MARNRGKKALYEVMSKARAKPGYGKTLEQMHPKKTEEVEPAVVQPRSAAEPSRAVADWWKKPSIAQFNAGRFEFSVPYQVAIVLGLVVVLLLLGSYRLGQNSQLTGQLATDEPSQGEVKTDDGATGGQVTAGIEEPVLPVEYVPPREEPPPAEDIAQDDDKEIVPVKPPGENAIVLAQSGRIVDFQPVVEFFAENDIELEIVPLENGKYELRTVARFERNPAYPGTDGFKLKSKIIQIGPSYKGRAPAGLDTFAPHYFTDAYGKKVED